MVESTVDRPRSAPRRRRSPAWAVAPATAVGAVVVALGAYLGAEPLTDNSFFTHLATGRLILADGIPRTDPYSFTAAGEPWVVQSWLASVAYGLADRAAGLVGVRGLVAVTTALVALTMWALTRPARGLVARFGVAVVGLFVGGTIWGPRPLMFGLLLLGVTLLTADRRLPAWVLLPAFWVWVNVHGSFPLGLLVLGCLAVGSRLDGARRPSELRPLAFAAAGTVLGALNPLGPVLLTFPLDLVGRQEVLSEVVEWQSPSFATSYGRAFLVTVGLAVAALVRRPSWRGAVPFVVFLAAALVATRNIPVATLVLVPIMARGAEGIGGLTGERRTRGGAVALVAVAVVGALLVGGRLSEPDLDLRAYPVDAVAWMDEQGLMAPDVRRASPDTVGNYLELVLGDRAEVFVDDRVDMFPADVFDDELTLVRGRGGWRTVLDRWDVDAVLWSRGAVLDQLLAEDDAWRLGYADQSWVVYTRR